MANLADHQETKSVKMLLIGDSGSGKTGSLASLIDAGYKLRILDFDNGLDPLISYVKDKKMLANVEYVTLTDKLKAGPTGPIPNGTPTAFSGALKILDNWPELGPVAKWDSADVLVIDSLTLMGEATLRYVLTLAGRMGQQPQIQDWGRAMSLVQDTLALLFSDAIPCHVIVTSHITFIATENEISKGYPSTLGNKLPPKVGRYFNTMVRAKMVGNKRVIRTSSDGMLELKIPVKDFPVQVPLETGMVQILEAIQGK